MAEMVVCSIFVCGEMFRMVQVSHSKTLTGLGFRACDPEFSAWN